MKFDKKNSTEQNRSSGFEKKVRDYKDGSGLQFINFDFMTGGQEIKIAILAWNSYFFSSYFVNFQFNFFVIFYFG